MIHFITYADGQPFEKSAARLAETSKSYGISSVKVWNRQGVEASKWFPQISHNSSLSTLASARNLCFAWKPFIIRETAQFAGENDTVLYVDSSKYDTEGWQEDPRAYEEFLDCLSAEDPAFFCGPSSALASNKDFSSSRLRAVLMGAELIEANLESKNAWKYARQAMGGVIFFKNNELNRLVLEDWCRLASESDFFGGNLRADQTAMNLLAFKHRIGSLDLDSLDLSQRPTLTRPHNREAKTHNLLPRQLNKESLTNQTGWISLPYSSISPSQRLMLLLKMRPAEIFEYIKMRLVYFKNSKPLLHDMLEVLLSRRAPSEVLTFYTSKLRRSKNSVAGS